MKRKLLLCPHCGKKTYKLGWPECTEFISCLRCGNYVKAKTLSECSPKGKKMFLKRYSEQEGRCAICGEEMEINKMTRDHILPRSKGGSSAWGNIQLTCSPCNEKKGDKFYGHQYL